MTINTGTHKGKGDSAHQSTHGRMKLGTASKEETSRLKDILIQSSRGKYYDLG
jgi:hypothetical protein